MHTVAVVSIVEGQLCRATVWEINYPVVTWGHYTLYGSSRVPWTVPHVGTHSTVGAFG